MTMPLTNPPIQILLATYNGGLFLREQLDSIFHQTLQDFTLLVWDDGSSDNTLEILEEYQLRYPDRMKIFKGPPSGSAKKNFIRLMEKADGDYLFLCDQDDVWLPEKIEHSLSAMKTLEKEKGQETPLLVHTDLQVVDRDLSIIDFSFEHHIGLRPIDTLKGALMQNDVTGCTAVYNRALSALFQAHLPNAENIVMHDWWLALIAHTFGEKQYVSLNEILYRQHGNNTMGAKKSYGLAYKIKKLFSGEAVKKALNETYRQAGEFHHCFQEDLSPTLAEMLIHFAAMENMGKWDRIRQMKRYGFFRKRFKQKIAQILFA